MKTEFNGIRFENCFNNEDGSERILYFDVPLEYLGEDYFDEEDRDKAVGATVSRSIQIIQTGLNLDLKFLQPTQAAVTSIGCSTTWIATSMKNL